MKNKENYDIKSNTLFILLFFGVCSLSYGQTKSLSSQEDVLKFKTKGYVNYRDFGAKADGKNNDMYAIAATHEFANQIGIKVKADDGATYYIGAEGPTAVIQTDTDFGTANFIIDDSEVKAESAQRQKSIFSVSSSQKPLKINEILSLKKNQNKINVSLPESCIISVTNSNVKQYIRFGKNQNDGSSLTDIFIADENGNIDKEAPIIWDFDQITTITAQPIDQKLLTITGGFFTTIANKAESKYNYYKRNITVKRSNVLIEGLTHYIKGEGEEGAPYNGFITITDCANVKIQKVTLTGRKTYKTAGNNGTEVSMGSYDLNLNRSINVSFINCTQTNDIKDRTYWGIMASNFCKNISYEGCTLSRFDAHQGVFNGSIRNSTIGQGGINAIGSGKLTVENTTVYSKSFINLREDYGSTWQGEFIIRNCKFVPSDSKSKNFSLIDGNNFGQHDFGYTCYMPERISIENLNIDDSNFVNNYQGGLVFDDFNSKMTNDSFLEKFPYIKTKEVVLKNVTTFSGKTLRLSDNLYMFKELKVKYLND